MDLRVPRTTPYIQDHTILGPDHTIEYGSGGELRWSVKGRGNGGDETTGTFREDDVVLICRQREPPAEQAPESELLLPPPGRPANTPSPAAGYTIYLVREAPDDADDEQPYRLSSISVPHLPQPLLDRHLLATAPAHLVGDAKAAAAPELHVIVSTRSGTGLAQAVYNTVLEKLLGAVLGLRAGDDLTPPDSPGGRGGARAAAAAEPAPAAARPSYNLFVTRSPHSIRQLAQARWSAAALRRRREGGGLAAASREKRRQLIVLLSGDGGVVELLNGADGPADDDNDAALPSLALLPLGTGNALFHSLHRPLHAGDGPSPLVCGLRTLFRGVSAPLPMFRATFSPGSTLVPPGAEGDDEAGAARPVDHLLGAIVASYGFHAQLVWESDTTEYRKHGAKRFGMAAGELLKLGHAYDAEVRLARGPGAGEEAVRPGGGDGAGGRFTYVLAAMVSNLERTFTISPASRPLDGRLRLVSFGAVGADRTMQIMQRAYGGGTHVDMAAEDGGRLVGYDEADQVHVVTHEPDPRWRKVCIDGTIVELPRHGSMRVRRAERARFGVLVDGRVV